ncbi:hypothetical protein J9332_32255, partial [Aquimarina celericrescens]|nr:hypothetical protein [Aquimarina celericrescens]
MKFLHAFTIIFLVLLFFSCKKEQENRHNFEYNSTSAKQEQIITKYVDSCAHNYSYYSREWQECLDKG